METRDLPGSGNITLNQVKAEFGKGNNLLSYLGEGGVTSTAPLKLTDFYGKSAGPDLVAWDNWTKQYTNAQNNQMISVLPTSGQGRRVIPVTNANYRMWGSPRYVSGYSSNGYTSYDSSVARCVQHMFDSLDNYNFCVSNQIPVVLSSGANLGTVSNFRAATHNGYTSLLWTSGEIGYGNFKMFFIDGQTGQGYVRYEDTQLSTFNWGRIHQSERLLDLFTEFADLDLDSARQFLQRHKPLAEHVSIPEPKATNLTPDPLLESECQD